ncbi:bifunctional DNA primase/polymerase [Streptomyces albidochromogenes]|uniref:Bifunctional DNA primase/polymerase n=1 Tax=Streptomyces albidochromogenes TaxID=329524 RepID=A0ABW6FS22_9ACTN
MAQSTALLKAALDAAARGWPVFPLRPGDKRPALHGETACPGTGECADGHAKWEQRATTDPDRIRRAWSAGAFNIGLATGPSGLLVVDLDQVKAKDGKGTPDGVSSFAALCERAGQPVPTTYRVRTAGGGEHLYFWVHRAIRMPSSKGRLAPKIDTRAWGGYVVAPGSIVGGTTYEVNPAPVAELPTWLMLALQAEPKPARPAAVALPRLGNRRAEVALERERVAVAGAQEGGREAELFRAARAMGRFVAWGEIARHVVEEAFQSAAESTGLPASQCRSTLRSALDWSIRTARPRETA